AYNKDHRKPDIDDKHGKRVRDAANVEPPGNGAQYERQQPGQEEEQEYARKLEDERPDQASQVKRRNDDQEHYKRLQPAIVLHKLSLMPLIRQSEIDNHYGREAAIMVINFTLLTQYECHTLCRRKHRA